jgi:hypothetical protein
MSQFDFSAFNKMTDDVAPGLKVALAEGLLKSALWNLERYNNPLQDDLLGIRMELKEFRVKYKAAAEARKARQENPSERTKEIDDGEKKSSTSADGGKIS